MEAKHNLDTFLSIPKHSSNLAGERMRRQYKSEIDIVATYLNGWAIQERAFLRTAAVNAGFVEAGKASGKALRFVLQLRLKL